MLAVGIRVRIIAGRKIDTVIPMTIRSLSFGSNSGMQSMCWSKFIIILQQDQTRSKWPLLVITGLPFRSWGHISESPCVIKPWLKNHLFVID